MNIYEKIFARLEELHMSQIELSRKTGIATSTISDWRKKKINPQADKLVTICKALDMSLVDLLCDEEETEQPIQTDYLLDKKHIIEVFNPSDIETKRRLLRYFELVEICKQINENNASKKNKRNVSVIQDIDGNNIVVINDIVFKGKRSVNWKNVREYLKKYIGDFYTIASTGDIVYIGSDLPNEYSGSKYTHSIKGTNAKAKANATQGIPELIEIAVGKHFRKNNEEKHWRNAKFGWYRYDSRFALPVYDEVGEIERYNVFHTSLIVRHSEDKKLYLYDILDIKKETSNPIEP
jgi:transcriptional regulator with XRE-family HTH domain